MAGYGGRAGVFTVPGSAPHFGGYAGKAKPRLCGKTNRKPKHDKHVAENDFSESGRWVVCIGFYFYVLIRRHTTFMFQKSWRYHFMAGDGGRAGAFKVPGPWVFRWPGHIF